MLNPDHVTRIHVGEALREAKSILACVQHKELLCEQSAGSISVGGLVDDDKQRSCGLRSDAGMGLSEECDEFTFVPVADADQYYKQHLRQRRATLKLWRRGAVARVDAHAEAQQELPCEMVDGKWGDKAAEQEALVGAVVCDEHDYENEEQARHGCDKRRGGGSRGGRKLKLKLNKPVLKKEGKAPRSSGGTKLTQDVVNNDGAKAAQSSVDGAETLCAEMESIDMLLQVEHCSNASGQVECPDNGAGASYSGSSASSGTQTDVTDAPKSDEQPGGPGAQGSQEADCGVFNDSISSTMPAADGEGKQAVQKRCAESLEEVKHCLDSIWAVVGEGDEQPVSKKARKNNDVGSMAAGRTTVNGFSLDCGSVVLESG